VDEFLKQYPALADWRFSPHVARCSSGLFFSIKQQ